MPAAESAPDLVVQILTRVALTELDDEFRAALIVLGAKTYQATAAMLAIALVACLMARSGLPRACVMRVIQGLSLLPEEQLDDLKSYVAVFNGAVIYVPGVQDGEFLRMTDLQPVSAESVAQPLMMVLYQTRFCLSLVKEVMKAD